METEGIRVPKNTLSLYKTQRNGIQNLWSI